MNNPYREPAPISDMAWAQIEEEASRLPLRHLTCMMRMTFAAHGARRHPHDMAADPVSFGIPAHVIAGFASLCHDNPRQSARHVAIEPPG